MVPGVVGSSPITHPRKKKQMHLHLLLFSRVAMGLEEGGPARGEIFRRDPRLSSVIPRAAGPWESVSLRCRAPLPKPSPRGEGGLPKARRMRWDRYSTTPAPSGHPLVPGEGLETRIAASLALLAMTGGSTRRVPSPKRRGDSRIARGRPMAAPTVGGGAFDAPPVGHGFIRAAGKSAGGTHKCVPYFLHSFDILRTPRASKKSPWVLERFTALFRNWIGCLVRSPRPIYRIS